MTMDEYQAQMSQNKEQFAANIAAAPVTAADVARFARAAGAARCARHHRGLVRRLAGASARPLPSRPRVRRPAQCPRLQAGRKQGPRGAVPDADRAAWRSRSSSSSISGCTKWADSSSGRRSATRRWRRSWRTSSPATPISARAGQPISALTPEARQALFVELGPWRKGRVDAWNRAAIAEFTAAAAVPAGV